MGSKRDTIVADVDKMAQDDVVELYGKLADQYLKVKAENDGFQQEIYHSSQQMKILTSSQQYLQQELESIQASHNDEIEGINRKHASVVAELRERNLELESDRNFYENKVDELSSRINELETKIKTAVVTEKPVAPRVSDGFRANLENENKNLQSSLNDLTEQLQKALAQVSSHSTTIEELKEKLMCLEDNLESKKSEIDEKNDAIEVLQETNNEQALELAMLKTAPDDEKRKGNSLFAEVDDQRQKMKSILQGERTHYLEMKKAFNAKELEIRRLKRENTNIKNEIQACSNLLARGEQVAIQTLTHRVNQLQAENKKLESQLVESEKKLIDLAKGKNLGWIETLLSTANNEARELKNKFFAASLQNTSLADNFNKTQKELAKARLDSVKYKVALARIVEAHNIDIDDVDLMQFVADDSDLLKAESSLSTEAPESLNESTIVLLGGRERLGTFAPPVKVEKEGKENSVAMESTKKDTKPEVVKSSILTPALLELNQIKKETEKAPKASETSEKAPKASDISKKSSMPHEKSPAISQKAQESKTPPQKTVKFSSKVSTAFVDGDPEPRKRAGIVVKRIVIPSKNKEPQQ